MSHQGSDEAEQASTTYAQGATGAQRRRVQVWFGRRVTAELVAEPAAADQYGAAMDRRSGGLRITNDPCPTRTLIHPGSKAAAHPTRAPAGRPPLFSCGRSPADRWAGVPTPLSARPPFHQASHRTRKSRHGELQQ